METQLCIPLLLLLLPLPLLCIVAYICSAVWLRPATVRRRLLRQGIRGPPPSLFYGNSKEMQRIIQLRVRELRPPICNYDDQIVGHDYTSTLFPYLEYWTKEYGPVYTYATGRRQHLFVNDPRLVAEMRHCMTLELGKPSYITKRLSPLLGKGIIRSNGLLWAQHRKIVAPPFFMDKVKGMVGLMAESMQPLLRKWEGCIEAQGGLEAAEIRVDEDLRGVSADVISRACFGTSFSQGKHIFSKLRALQKAISSDHNLLFGLPIHGFMRRKKQKEIRELEKEIEGLIWDTVKGREKKNKLGQDRRCCPDPGDKNLLEMILEGALMDERLDEESSKRFIVDNCKNIYFAGHESTAVAISWCLLLLALFPDWQARIRAEIAQVFNNHLPDAQSVPALKTVTYVIQEALRLFPPAAFISREALKDTQIGNIIIPKGVCLWSLIPKLHRDPEIWGSNSNQFKPERFAEGVFKTCKFPQAYVPFGIGPRSCLGKNFAMAHMKVVISLIVSNFSFSLSPKYCHLPTYRMIIEPGDGVRIVVKKLE